MTNIQEVLDELWLAGQFENAGPDYWGPDQDLK